MPSPHRARHLSALPCLCPLALTISSEALCPGMESLSPLLRVKLTEATPPHAFMVIFNMSHSEALTLLPCVARCSSLRTSALMTPCSDWFRLGNSIPSSVYRVLSWRTRKDMGHETGRMLIKQRGDEGGDKEALVKRRRCAPFVRGFDVLT